MEHVQPDAAAGGASVVTAYHDQPGRHSADCGLGGLSAAGDDPGGAWFAIVGHRTGAITPTSAHGRLLAQRLEREWRRTTDAPLRLVGGDLDLANVVAFYLPDQPSTFPFSEPQLAPWANDERISRQGIAIVCQSTGPISSISS